MISCRTMLALWVVLWWRGCYILEQPSTSVMKYHPRWVEISRLYGLQTVTTFLGAWKHWTPKLTTFFSNRPEPQFPVLAQMFSCLPFVFVRVLNLRSWVSGLYRRLTKEERVEMERRREALGYEKPTKRTPSGVTGTRSLRATQ